MNFRSYGSYLTEKYGKRAYRVGVDAGFSCPNRENGRGGFGCAFCDEAGSRAAYIRNDNGSYPESDAFKPCGLPGYPPGYSAEAVRSQIDRGIAFLRRRYRAEVFLLYFQAYSGTYAPPEILKRIYDDALAAASFSELIVSTRPDCLDGEKADLLASYRRPDFDVWCETGLQTVHDKTLLAVRRGHTYADFLKSYRLLKERNIKTAVHLIFGLPGEGRTELTQTIDEINRLQTEEHQSPYTAVIEATVSRVRPVLMASLTTIVGMIPLVGDPMYGSMALTIMGGLTVGTIITLVLLPLFYAAMFRIRKPQNA